MTYKKKLIEVALPLEAINKESSREKSIRHGHPSTLHMWWARRPLAACRAVLFASLVDDPSSRPDLFPTEEIQDSERQRLFKLIEELVKWENSQNNTVLEAARTEILRSCGGHPPEVADPFAGGGSIPLEAKRLGLVARATDLNPIPVLINKAQLEFPTKFGLRAPVLPVDRPSLISGVSCSGLAADIRSMGKWIEDQAKLSIGQFYPAAARAGRPPAEPLAWLWARTVKCPNPACGVDLPLIRSFLLSNIGKRPAMLTVNYEPGSMRPTFGVSMAPGTPLSGTVGRGGARCLSCGTTAPLDHVKEQGQAAGLGMQLMTTVVGSGPNRTFLPPDSLQEEVALSAQPAWAPETELSSHPQYMGTPRYGLTHHSDLFTPRGLLAMTTFADLIVPAREHLVETGRSNPSPKDASDLDGYADAVATYVAFALDKCADYWTTLATWMPRGTIGHAFTRQAMPMTWDFAEANPFAAFHCSWSEAVNWVAKAVEGLPVDGAGTSVQLDARSIEAKAPTLVSTDPPYYDNVPYADLSDFFYVWLRRSIGSLYPDLLGTLLAPKTDELVADQVRQGSRHAAQDYFEVGLTDVFRRFGDVAHPDFPVTVYYGFKQADEEAHPDRPDEVQATSIGWESVLSALMAAGFQIVGTWPLRTERSGRMREIGSNALASSVALVCRPREKSAGVIARREFVTDLNAQLPEALRNLQAGNIAPVDLAQAAIGPGMAVFSRHERVVEADGKDMSLRAALALINQSLDEVLTEHEAEVDTPTRWAITWFDQFGFDFGPFGSADNMARAKNTSVAVLAESGVVEATAGRVRLRQRAELTKDPHLGDSTVAWNAAQRLLKALEEEGEMAAARIYHRLGSAADGGREVAYRLFAIAEKRKMQSEAVAYNSLVIAWPEITRLANALPASTQQRMDF